MGRKITKFVVALNLVAIGVISQNVISGDPIAIGLLLLCSLLAYLNYLTL